MIYFTSDTHFSHDKDFIYSPRGFNSLEEEETTLISNWNSIVTNEDDYSSIDEEVFQNAFNQLFIDGYNKDNFVYNDNKLRFISKFNEYISDTILKKDLLVERKIIDIKEENNNILIITSEKINNHDYKVAYTFENEKLVNISTR